MEGTQPWKPLKRFFKLLELDRRDITYIYIYAIFSGLITLGLPLGVQAIIGLIAGGSISASVVLLVLAVTLATALTGILKVMQMTVTETIQQRIFSRSSFDFSYRIPRLQLDNLSQHYPPELVNRFFDTLTLQKGVPKILMDFSTAVLQILFGVILISFYHPFFVFFGVMLILMLFFIFRYSGPSGLDSSLKESKYKYEVAYWLEELARSMNTFKLSGGSPLALSRTDNLVCNYLDSRKKHFRVLLFQYGNIVAFEILITGALLFLGSYLVINNQINIGQFVAAEIVVILVIASVEKLIISMETVYDVLTALEKLGSITDLPLESGGKIPFSEIDNGKGFRVRIDELRFRFPDAERFTINDLSLEVASGERVCIAGYNGSGKTTLLQLLSGLYNDFEGSINYNDIPLRSLDLESLRAYIGDYSTQEHIFRGTISENISLGHPEVSLEDVIRTAQTVGLSSFVQRLPNGYETMLLPEGRNIPQHIRTKIILARCLVFRPRLLTVEGFFNHLDYSDRRQIADVLTAPDRCWTLITITNDPLLASRCDRVLVLKEGRLIEEGSFEQIRNSPHFPVVFRGAPPPNLEVEESQPNGLSADTGAPPLK